MLLRLTTIVAAFLLWVPVAQAWSWPVQGPVLQPFVYDEAHPYAAGQHRGIDIGAAAAGGPVVAPASGTVSFAGSVPASGTCLTIETPDGYAVTLTHLGSLAVAKGAVVAEGDVVGTVGPSGTAEEPGPYVHLGIRSSADANGYLDPLGLLPTLVPPPQGSSGGSSAPAGSGDVSSTAPAPAATTPAETAPAEAGGSGLVIQNRPAAPRTARPPVRRPVRSPAPVQHGIRDVRHPQQTADEPRTLRRPFEEPTRLRPSAPASPPAARPAPVLLPLALGAGPGVVAALAALAAAFVRRRRRPPALVVHFPRELEARRAA